MQTFLPEPTFSASAAALDSRRLGKQRVECLQLLNALKQGPTKLVEDPKGLLGDLKEIKTPWYNHPACRMWRGWEQSLIDYGLLVCVEWKQRGFKDTCYEKIMTFTEWASNVDFRYQMPAGAQQYCSTDDIWIPSWINETFITAHRSNLIRKDPKFYQPKWPDIPDDLPYVWPVK